MLWLKVFSSSKSWFSAVDSFYQLNFSWSVIQTLGCLYSLFVNGHSLFDVVGWLVGFYCISNIVGYLLSNPVLYHHHHHVLPLARISLTLSRHFSLSFIATGRSSGLHPVSSHSCWMYVWGSIRVHHLWDCTYTFANHTIQIQMQAKTGGLCCSDTSWLRFFDTRRKTQFLLCWPYYLTPKKRTADPVMFNISIHLYR